MKQWKRLAFFLFLNILVSACTTLAVLVIWDQTRAPLPGGLIQPITISLKRPAQVTPTATALAVTPTSLSPTPAVEIHSVLDGETFESIAQFYGVSIDDLVKANGYSQAQILSPGELLRIPISPALIGSVIGAGDLETERVKIVNNLSGELPLAGWQLENNTGSSYIFPAVTLFTRGGEVDLYTKAGTDTTGELYWGLQQPLWQTGSLVTLRDPQGKVQATYSVP